MAKLEKENNQLLLEVESKLDLLVKKQASNSNKLEGIGNDLRKDFIGLALRNEELLKSNDQMKQQLDEVLKELNRIKKEREEKAARKEARANRKRRPKRDPMTPEIYTKLIQTAKGPAYIKVRVRIAICLLTITGIRINELLPLKVYQLQKLVEEGWIDIDRSKRGTSNHKAYLTLTKEGKKIIEDLKKDFQFIFLIKEPNAYVFTSEANHYQKLRREAITRDVNKVMRSVSKQLPGQPNITSHSFRIGYNLSNLFTQEKRIDQFK